MAEFRPKFLSKNLINDITTIGDQDVIIDYSDEILVDYSSIPIVGYSFENSSSQRKKLFDRNENNIFYSTETSGTTLINWTPSSSQTISRIIIQNCNWKTFTIKYNSTSDFSTPISISNSTHENFYFEFNPVSVDSIDIAITDTHTASDNRSVGQIIFATELMEWDETYTDDINIKADGKAIMQKLSDGVYFKTWVRDAVMFDIKLEAVPLTEKENFRTIYETNRKDTVVFVPNPRTQTDQFDGISPHVNWGNNWDFDNYHRGLEANGFDAKIKLYQAGGNT